jgi:hypothetical protein
MYTPLLKELLVSIKCYCNKNVFVEKKGTYYSYQLIVNPSALTEHIKEVRLTKCINKATLIPAVNSFVESSICQG